MPDASEAARILRSLPRELRQRVCPVCGKDFTGQGNRAKYCSPECRWQGWDKRRRGARRLAGQAEEEREK